MMSLPRPGRLLAAIAIVLALTTSALAQEAQRLPSIEFSGDYSIYNEEWNGLTTFVAVVRGMGLRVRAPHMVDWGEIDRDDVLVLLYPTSQLDPSHLSAFVRNGGRVLIADDFGRSDQLLAQLGSILRSDAIGVGAARYHDDRPFAPIAQPYLPEHPLAQGVEELATNHPAILPEMGGAEAVIGFGRGEAVVAAGTLGSGRFVVLSDPSVFINRMMQFPGNLQFAINVIRYLKIDGSTTRIVVVAGEFETRGQPKGLLDDGTVRGSLSNMLSEFNMWLDDLNKYLLTEVSLRILAALLAVGIAVLAASSLPLMRRSKLDGSWTRAASGAEGLPSFETMVAHFDDERGRRSFAYPAAVLRDSLDYQLGQLLEVRDPLSTMKQNEVLTLLAGARGQRAASSLRAVFAQLGQLPTREQAASPWESRYLSRKDFDRLRASVHDVRTKLGVEFSDS